MAELRARALAGIPEVRAGADIAELVVRAAGDELPRAGQAVVVAHTIVSKAEGAVVLLRDVAPGEQALTIAREQEKDPRLVQVVLDESVEVLRCERGVIVSRTAHGLVCANAGVDASNAPAADAVVLLPRDPDASARAIRRRLRELLAQRSGAGAPVPAVLIGDSFGRTWRHGQVDVAIGLAGMKPLDDWRGRLDAGGRPLQATWIAVADAAAGAAELVRAKDSSEPLVLVDGLQRFVTDEDGPGAAALLRSPEEDLFR